MVRLEKNKLIIEIETVNAAEDFETLNNALVDALCSLHPDMLNKDYIYPILDLLKAMQPTFKQINKAFTNL